MRKMMFNDQYGLTQAVLEGRKTMTRRIISESDITGSLILHISILDYSRYKVGDIVAIAQSYRSIYGDDAIMIPEISSAGMDNKMFVKADLMLHQIRITDIKVERLKDISDDDCLKEGVMKESSFPYKKSSPYFLHGGKYSYENHYTTQRKAFAALIDKVSGKGTWERNPWVFAYTFELIK